MYPTHGKQQNKEIETIRPRKIEVKLSDADVKRISEKAAAHGLTVGELIENFIGDLVCGTYSNGSDERMYAEQWFDRCWFSMFPDLTFLRYLIEWGGADDVLRLYDDIQSSKEEISYYEKHPEDAGQDEVAEIQEDIDYWQEQLDDYWKEYTEQQKEYKSGTFDEEMKIVLDYWQRYQQFLGEEEAEKQGENK